MEKVSQMSMHASLPQTDGPVLMFQYCTEENVHFVLTFDLCVAKQFKMVCALHSLMEATPVAALTHYNHSWEHAYGGTAGVGNAHFSCA